jgi:hypothetical protein
MKSEIERLTLILSEHRGMSPDAVTLLALEASLIKNNGAHLLRPKKEPALKPDRVVKAPAPPKPKGILNGAYEWAVESFTPVPKSINHVLVVAHENGERFAFKCSGSDWIPLMNTYATPGPDGVLAGGRLKLIAYGGRPTKFVTASGSFDLDPIPLPEQKRE